MREGLTVGAVIANAARARPDATAALIDERPISFSELDEAGTAIGRRLIAAGVEPGSIAVVMAPTSFEMLAHFVGCARAGVVFAPVNPALDPGALAAVIETVKPRVALVDPTFEAMFEPFSLPLAWLSEGPGGESEALPVVGADDPHVVFFTSGSTGRPKGVLLAHRTSVLRSHPGAQLEERGAALCPYPLFHMAGWTISLQQWHARAPVVFVEGTDARTLAAALRTHEIERFNAVPALWSRLADHLGPAGAGAFPRLRFADTGTSPTSVELLETIGRLAPAAQVRVFYGSSEAGNVASLAHGEILERPGSCGLPSVLTEVAIGADDELLVRGPLLFEEYVGQPDATARALREGWYHTGDRASVDADGYLSIFGRLGNLIRTGGETVAPAVVETALGEHPAIRDVAVFGLPDADWGEIVVAAVVSADPLALPDVRAHLAPDGPCPLPAHQHPRLLLSLDELPRTAVTDQVDRGRLRELAITADTAGSSGPDR